MYTIKVMPNSPPLVFPNSTAQLPVKVDERPTDQYSDIGGLEKHLFGSQKCGEKNCGLILLVQNSSRLTSHGKSTTLMEPGKMVKVLCRLFPSDLVPNGLN